MHSNFVLCHENAEGFEENRKYVYNLLPAIVELWYLGAWEARRVRITKKKMVFFCSMEGLTCQ